MLVMPDSISKGSRSDLVKTLEIDNAHAVASISLWGAQLMSFKPKHDNRERFFTAGNLVLDGSKSLRAGVPVCWPWFAQREGYQKHGYVRINPWRVVSAKDTQDYTEIVLKPISTKGKGFEGEADLSFTVRVGKTLEVTLTTTNNSKVAFSYDAAFHTYFLVDDIADVELQGFSGLYQDKTRNKSEFETPLDYRITEETDRIHLEHNKEVSIVQPHSETKVSSAGHDSIVVWNPWQESSSKLRDMAPEDYRRMICVETAVTKGKTLEPTESNSLTQIVS